MFLTVQNPHGEVTSIALTDLAVWMLELRATRYHQQPPEDPEAKNEPRTLALGIVCVSNGAMIFTPIAGIDLGTVNGEVSSIASEGFTKGSTAANKEHLRDRLGMLHNGSGDSGTAVDALIARASVLADVHGAITKALWGAQVALDNSVAPLVKGEFESWKYAITRTRFEAVFVPGLAAAEGMGIVPGMPGNRPPPPTDKGSSKRKPPVTAATAADAGKPDPSDTPPADGDRPLPPEG